MKRLNDQRPTTNDERLIMAARATWKGFLKISLVNIPIKVFPATGIGCHPLVQSAPRRVSNAHPAEALVSALQPRSAQFGDRQGLRVRKGHYVVLTEEDFEKVRPESTRVIDLAQFADESAIDPIYVDRAYYLAPDGPVAAQAFAVMREGMKGKVGIGKLALYGREYLVAVRPHRRGIVMYACTMPPRSGASIR